ncbi:MAG TPA: DUF3108 domain-containing protein [Chthoniobacteraceae bacterium]|jgi:hypothetical protein
MKFLGSLLLVLAVLTAGARADWQTELSSTDPGGFLPLRPLHAHYKFGWTAFTAAEATFDYTHAKGGLTRMEVDAKTIGFVRTLWKLDAKHVALMDPSTLRPVTMRQKEIYHDKTLLTTLDFNSEGVVRQRQTLPYDAKAKTKHFDYPGLFDLNSALHWVRSQRLKQGDVYKLVVYPATTPYLAEVDVVGRQKLNVAGKEWNAVKLELKLWHITDDFELEPHTKFKHAYIWTSDDANRVLLKINAEIFVGSVWAELDALDVK